jgi:predicted DNA-binding transcriptional regulator AlpA
MNGLESIPADISRDRVINAKQAAEFVGVSLPHFRRLYRAEKVPAPIKIGERKFGWRLGTIADFIASKEAAQ